MTTGDVGGLGVWGFVGGATLFVALNANVAKQSIKRVIRWCLGVGGVSVAFFALHWLLGLTAMSPKALLAFGFFGLPVLVAGLALLITHAVKRGGPGADVGAQQPVGGRRAGRSASYESPER